MHNERSLVTWEDTCSIVSYLVYRGEEADITDVTAFFVYIRVLNVSESRNCR